jgi:hypothetical protein
VNRWFGVSSTSTGSNTGLKPNGAARDCGSRSRGFDSLPSLQFLCGPVAQLAERRTCNAEVEISTFSRSTKFGFVAQMVEHHAEDVSAAVSKSAEATKLSGCSSGCAERLPWEQGARGSNPSIQTIR